DRQRAILGGAEAPVVAGSTHAARKCNACEQHHRRGYAHPFLLLDAKRLCRAAQNRQFTGDPSCWTVDCAAVYYAAGKSAVKKRAAALSTARLRSYARSPRRRRPMAERRLVPAVYCRTSGSRL